MKKLILTVLLSLSLVGSMMLAGCGSDDSEEASADPLKVKCSNGIMLGQEENDVISFKGVPYAEQPVGDLRWKAPVKAAEGDEEIECYEYGHTALQTEDPTEQASLTEKGEDCLSLNIWKSKKAGDEPLPVMVWIHGGAYGWGGTTDPLYDGQKFIEANPDVMLVTINYRLGIMSWADFTQVKGGEEYTDYNLGTRDKICALEWVQENIKQFGGNSDNVTIYGESAGSSAVGTLLISPMAEGLFHKAIMQSTELVVGTQKEAQKLAQALVNASNAKSMDDLLALSTEEILALDEEHYVALESPGTWADGEVIPENYNDLLTEAGSSGIPLMVGSNADESYYDVCVMGGTKEAFDEYINYVWDSDYEAVDDEGKVAMDKILELEMATGKDEIFAKSAYRTEAAFRVPLIDVAERYSDGGGTVYMYRWDVPSTSKEFFKGACHAIELSYIFNNLDVEIYAGKNQDEETGKKSQEAWTNFAKTGDPSIEGVEWPAYDKKSRETMIISLDGWKVESDPDSELRKQGSIVLKKLTE